MVMEDINSARPRYLQWTLFRDYHYAVFDTNGTMVAILVTDKGQLKSYWVSEFNEKVHAIVYENHIEQARIMVGDYVRDCTDLLDYLKLNHLSAEFALSIVDASGKRLYSYSIWI